MHTETTYYPDDLTHGTCSCCGDTSDEILKGDGRCLDCIEEEKFYLQTMRDASSLEKFEGFWNVIKDKI